MSIFDHPDRVPAASPWRCPHCGQLQAETSRCWRCTRAAVTCASCHLFRKAVATDLGYCADDTARTPLNGEEVQACWEAVPAAPTAPGLFAELDAPPPPAAAATVTPPPRRRRLAARAAKPPLEEPRAAAWAEAPAGQLTEAPRVEPGRQLMSEVKRRRRRRWSLR